MAVQRLLDKSAKKRHASFPIGARPSLIASDPAINNEPAVQFTGSEYGTTKPFPINYSKGLTISYVVANSSTGVQSTILGIRDSFVQNGRWNVRFTAGSYVQYETAWPPDVPYATTNPYNNDYFIISIILDSDGSLNIYVNSISVLSGSTTVPADLGVVPMSVGAQVVSSAVDFFNGKFAACVHHSKALTVQELTDGLWAYWSTKYDIFLGVPPEFPSGLVLDLDSRYGITTINDGTYDRVDNWANQIDPAQNMYAYAPTGIVRPRYIADDGNGVPFLYFEWTGLYMIINQVVGGITNGTIAMVGRSLDPEFNGFGVYISGHNNNRPRIRHDSSYRFQTQWSGVNSYNMGNTPNGVKFYHVMRSVAGASSLHILNEARPQHGIGTGSGFPTAKDWYINGLRNQTQFYTFQLFRILLWNRALSITEAIEMTDDILSNDYVDLIY